MLYEDFPQDNIPPDSLTNARTLNEVVVYGANPMKRTELGRMSIMGSQINRQPVLFGERDLVKALQSTSGVVAGTEGFAGLYVRGGETDQNLYLLDGLPLVNVYHFGGLFSTFNTQSVKTVDFYKGAIPSKFSGNASSVVDVRLKEPDLGKTTGTFSVGLISGQLYLSTPVVRERSAVSLSMRRTWFDIFSTPALAIMNHNKKSQGRKAILNYNFTDFQFKFYATDALRNRLSLLMFYGKDNFKLGEVRFEPVNHKNLFQSNLNKMTWGNWSSTLDYRFNYDNFELKIQPFVSKAFSTDRQYSTSFIGNADGFKTESSISPSVLQIGINESVLLHPTNWMSFSAGAQQVWYDYGLGISSSQNAEQDLVGTDVNESNSNESHVKTGLLSGYIEANWNVGSIFHISTGIRANRFLSKYESHWNIEPRAGLKLAFKDASLDSNGKCKFNQEASKKQLKVKHNLIFYVVFY